ncbi:E3 ubiquitin- ligase PDZRN3-like [Paramuricea clavata]|uniref:E3 ubiquitin- ligase PDZRN3-like n=1 Tax=Paramuricea clavata TaxID=317549 RepID=A0A7D9J3B2_PARCT|nr:E3 ubiquitin- ligase PDZRN3-like [Paramuricea clavata]
MDELTPDTLVQPPRLLLNCISELRIKCIYSNRGCPEYVKLSNLQNHVDQCGFAPAKCGNEGCGAKVNECEKVRYETELCKFRKVECYGCGELKKEMMAEVLDSQSRMKEGVKQALKESLDKIESIFEATQSNSRPKVRAQTLKTDVARSLRQFNHGINHDIFIMGSFGKDYKPTNSVEKFCSREGRWVDVGPMNVPRASASSVVLGNQVIVSGGTTYNLQSGRNAPTDSVEILNLDQCPLQWEMSDIKLPAPQACHQTFIYKGKLIVICESFKKDGFTFFEISLTPPHAHKELFSLASYRFSYQVGDFYKAELVNEKVFVWWDIRRQFEGCINLRSCGK